MKKPNTENSEQLKTCKKCGRILPADRKQKLCESCQGNKIENIKKIGAGIAGAAATAGGIVLAVVKGIAKR